MAAVAATRGAKVQRVNARRYPGTPERGAFDAFHLRFPVAVCIPHNLRLNHKHVKNPIHFN
jgi:hypothetical protein